MKNQRLDPPEQEMCSEDVELVHDAAALIDEAAAKLEDVMPEQAAELQRMATWLLCQAGAIPLSFEDVE